MTKLAIGDLVEGGTGEDYDTGRVIETARDAAPDWVTTELEAEFGKYVEVAWSGGVRAWTPVTDIRLKSSNHPNRNRKFYAAQSPRGFANEINVHTFTSRQARDKWVAAHEDDGDVNSASQGAYMITSKRAREILGYRGDAATESFNGSIEH